MRGTYTVGGGGRYSVINEGHSHSWGGGEDTVQSMRGTYTIRGGGGGRYSVINEEHLHNSRGGGQCNQ